MKASCYAKKRISKIYPSQRWTLSEKIPVIKDGKRTYQVIYAKSQKEMDLRLEEIKYQQRKGIDISSQMTLFENRKINA